MDGRMDGLYCVLVIWLWEYGAKKGGEERGGGGGRETGVNRIESNVSQVRYLSQSCFERGGRTKFEDRVP